MPLALETISDKGAVPASRIKDADSARQIHSALWEDDRLNSLQRARVQGMIDGNPPYDPEELVQLGQAGRSNVNWGASRARVKDALIPHYDMVTSVPCYATILTDIGGPTVSAEYGRIISEEFHRMLDEWDGFLDMIQMHQKEKVIHGIGPCFWKDGIDWRPKAIKRRHFQCASNSKSANNDMKVVFIDDYMEVDELYSYILNPEVAKATGWKEDRVKQAIMQAGQVEEDRTRNWEWWQEQLKDNCLYVSYARTSTVQIIHAYVQEFDQKISHHILTKDSLLKDDGFIYSKVGKFEKWSHCMRLFFDSIGNGDFKSVRGLGWEVYPFGEVSNRLNNTLVDGAIQGSCDLWQANSGADISKFAAIEIGPNRIIPPGVNHIQINKGPALNTALTVAGHFQMIEQSNTGSYKGSLVKEGNPVTAEEIIAQQGEKAKIASSEAQHYIKDLDGLYAEMYRRAKNTKLVRDVDPGANAALDFQKRCKDRGVPSEAIQKAVSVKATRAIGNGSSSGRRMAMMTLYPLIQWMPEEKKKVFLRDLFAASVDDQKAAERYGPDLNEQPPGMDESIASLENGSFMTGTPVVLTPDQNHFIHATYHVNFMLGLINEVKDGVTDPKTADLALSEGGPHTQEHIDLLSQNPLRKGDVQELMAMMGQVMKDADQIRKLADEQREQEANANPTSDAWLAKTQERVNINYKDAPPDVQRQIEGLLGLKPSTMPSLAEEKVQLQKDKQATSTAKTRQDMAVKDIDTAMEVRDRMNGSKPNGSKNE